MTIPQTDRVPGGHRGAAVGNALGILVQFLSREEVRQKKITVMTSHGTFNLPAGS